MPNYWTEETDKAIKQYKHSASHKRRNIIFTTNIYPAFKKVAECIYRKQKVIYRDDTEQNEINDLISKMVMAIEKFDETRKGYSYFTRVAVNATWDRCNANYKQQERVISNEENKHDYPVHDVSDEKEFNKLLFINIKKCFNELFITKDEIAVGNALLHIIQDGGTDGVSVKYTNYYLRDISGVKYSIIQSVMKKVKPRATILLQEYYEGKY